MVNYVRMLNSKYECPFFLELVLAISTLCGYSDVCALLRGKDTLVLAIFDHFKLVLTKDKWKDYPVHKQALIWIIKHIKVRRARMGNKEFLYIFHSILTLHLTWAQSSLQHSGC